MVLDRVTDPQNFGSILRSVFFLGADGIIVRKRGSCPLTPAVSKVSSGAMEYQPVLQVKFLSQFLQEAKRAGWVLITTQTEEEEEEDVSEKSD